MTIDASLPSSDEEPKPLRKPRPRGLWLKQHLRTRPETAARRLSETVHGKLLAKETRGRARREVDAKRFADVVDLMAANLARLALRHPSDGNAWLFYTRSKQRKRQQKSFPRSLPKVVDAMRDAGLVTSRDAIAHPKNGMASRVKPSDALLALIEEHEPAAADIVDTEVKPLVRLRDKRTKAWGRWHKEDARGPLINFKPTAETERWSRELEAINEFLAQVCITYDPALAEAELVRRGQSIDGLPDTLPIHERTLRRTFLRRSWREGGRLGGSAFWMHADRRARLGLRVATPAAPEGEPFVLLDFVSAFLQLSYTKLAGQQTPLDEVDLYEGIIGERGKYGAPWPSDPSAKAALRGAIKRNLSASLFRDASAGPRKKVVRDTRQILDQYGGGISVAELDARIQKRHPPIAKWINSDIGFELMFHESEIMVRILLRCHDAGVPVLPLHDGLLVPQSQWQVAREAMRVAFYTYTGSPIALTARRLPMALGTRWRLRDWSYLSGMTATMMA